MRKGIIINCWALNLILTKSIVWVLLSLYNKFFEICRQFNL